MERRQLNFLKNTFLVNTAVIVDIESQHYKLNENKVYTYVF